jgi:hypothetical protein
MRKIGPLKIVTVSYSCRPCRYLAQKGEIFKNSYLNFCNHKDLNNKEIENKLIHPGRGVCLDTPEWCPVLIKRRNK